MNHLDTKLTKSKQRANLGVFFFALVVPFAIVTALQSQAFAQNNAFADVIESSNDKLVKVSGAGVGQVQGYATGILVSNDGKILTMQGVFLDGNSVRITTSDGQEHSATVLKRDRRLRLALLQIDLKTEHFFKLDEKTVGKQGDWVVAISNAFQVAQLDEPLSTMIGIISLRTSIQAEINSRDTAYSGPMILLDAITSNPGGGGGAVVNRDGDLVGMIGRTIDSTETNTRLNYAVPRKEIYRFVHSIKDPKQTIAPNTVKGKPLDLGIRIFKLSGTSAEAYVDRVKRGSFAQKAGIRADDLVVSINGQKIDSVKDYLRVTKALTDQTEAVVVVARKGVLYRHLLNSRQPPNSK